MLVQVDKLLANFALWQWLPEVSWLWWNLSGFLIALLVAGIRLPADWRSLPGRPAGLHRSLLVGMAAVIFSVCVYFQTL